MSGGPDDLEAKINSPSRRDLLAAAALGASAAALAGAGIYGLNKHLEGKRSKEQVANTIDFMAFFDSVVNDRENPTTSTIIKNWLEVLGDERSVLLKNALAVYVNERMKEHGEKYLVALTKKKEAERVSEQTLESETFALEYLKKLNIPLDPRAHPQAVKNITAIFAQRAEMRLKEGK